MAEATHKAKRSVSGVVTSARMDKTIIVLVERKVRHPVYGKVVRRSTKLRAHDERNQGRVGDVVTVQQCRPISKTKAWMLKSIDERAAAV